MGLNKTPITVHPLEVTSPLDKHPGTGVEIPNFEFGNNEKGSADSTENENILDDSLHGNKFNYNDNNDGQLTLILAPQVQRNEGNDSLLTTPAVVNPHKRWQPPSLQTLLVVTTATTDDDATPPVAVATHTDLVHPTKGAPKVPQASSFGVCLVPS
ncbi:hypothetical protein PIB30_073534 [Stylosanthes scabra]|uniref:Uncharacterized protein n=1 Tax=Stylosanthes scabra TaxID=79078 RepID=A0ABU6UT39_9FABA|nr:hypothetical protein [Stylosanthes scabra]